MHVGAVQSCDSVGELGAVLYPWVLCGDREPSVNVWSPELEDVGVHAGDAIIEGRGIKLPMINLLCVGSVEK